MGLGYQFGTCSRLFSHATLHLVEGQEYPRGGKVDPEIRMTQMGRKRATYADLEAVPPEKVAELIDGELFVSPRPRGRHAKAAGLLFADLVREFEGDPSRR